MASYIILATVFLASQSLMAQVKPHLRAQPIQPDVSGDTRNLAKVEPFEQNSIHREYFQQLQSQYGSDFSKLGLGVSMWAKRDAEGRFQYKDVATFAANARRASRYVDVDDGMGLIRAMESFTSTNGCIPRLMIGTHGLASDFGSHGFSGVYPEGDGGFYLSDRFKLDAVPRNPDDLKPGAPMPEGTMSARMAHWTRHSQLTRKISDPQSKLQQFMQTSATTDDLELRVRGSLESYANFQLVPRTRQVEVVVEAERERKGLFGKNKGKKPAKTVLRTEVTYEPKVQLERRESPVTIKFCKPCIIQLHSCTVSPKFGSELARISGCQTVWSTGKCAPLDFHGTGYDNGKMDYMWKATKYPGHHVVRKYQESQGIDPFFGNFVRATPDSSGVVHMEDAGSRYVADEYGVSPEAKQIFDHERSKRLKELIDEKSNPVLNEKLGL